MADGAGSDEGPVRTFEDVAKEDTEFRMQAYANDDTSAADCAALKLVFKESSTEQEKMRAAFDAVFADASKAKWTSCQSTWETIMSHSLDDAALSSAVKKVEEDFDAPHLRPSGILERLQQGNNSACHGLVALCGHLDRQLATK